MAWRRVTSTYSSLTGRNIKEPRQCRSEGQRTTRAITLQSSSGGNVPFPLYYFGILAALIVAGILEAFLVFRRRKVTHAKLKIDLEAVKTEAGRIEDQDFFRSVKDQLNKEKE